MTDVFLSYKAEDRARVAPLVQALERDGLSVWWDEHIGGGDDWRDEIQSQLDGARCVIVVWSKRSIGPDGHFVRDEANRALRRHAYLPVLVDRVDPPLGFGETQALSLVGWKGKVDDPRFRALAGAARSIIAGKEYRAPPSAAAPAAIDRRAVIAGGAVAVAAAGLGGWFALKPGSNGAAESIAVLPFANLSGDPDQAYFSDGMAEELRSALSRIGGLKVVARTSSEAVRDDDAKTAAQKLGVANILTGSVRRSPSMIRISAQLVDGRKGIERWSETYDRSAGDALQIQTDIANTVAETLSIQLGIDGRDKLTEGGTHNPAAHDLLLKAEAYTVANEGSEALQRAIGMIDSALALDPGYADAFAIKANYLRIQAGSMSATAAEALNNYAQAAAAAKRAIQLAPRSSLGYAALGTILDQQFHRRAALAQFEKARSLSGGDPKILQDYAVLLSEIGRHDEATRLADQIVAVDPLNPFAYSSKSVILGNARRYAEALAVTEKNMELAPGRAGPRARHAYLQMMLGRLDKARAELDRVPDDNFIRLTLRAVLAARRGEMAESERIFARVRAVSNDAGYYQHAEILAQQGKKAEAIDALDRAYRARDSGLTTILVDPLVDPLRNEPRFKDLVKRLDFPT